MAGSVLMMPLLVSCRDPVRRPAGVAPGGHAADDAEALRGNAVVVRGIGIVDQLRSVPGVVAYPQRREGRRC
jgi:hypothetical protein